MTYLGAVNLSEDNASGTYYCRFSQSYVRLVGSSYTCTGWLERQTNHNESNKAFVFTVRAEARVGRLLQLGGEVVKFFH